LDDLSQVWRKYKWTANGAFVFPDCKTAATYHDMDEKVETKLWDLSTGRLLATFPSDSLKGHIRFMDFPPNGKPILANVMPTRVSTAIWDVSGQPKLIAILTLGHIAVSEDRHWLLQSEARGVSLVNSRSRKEISLTRASDTPSISSVSISGAF